MPLDQRINPFTGCTGNSTCTSEHQFEWRNCHSYGLDIRTLQTICCAVLEHASKLESGALFRPDPFKTIVTCKGNVHTMVWDPFRLGTPKDSKPETPMDAALASCLWMLRYNTDSRSGAFAYGIHSLGPSQEVLSRNDIIKQYKTLLSKSKVEMCNGIRSIRLQNFMDERKEYNKDLWY
jgi:hypothetical protein